MNRDRRRQGLPAGYDEGNPYEDVDVSTLPQWWRRQIEEFEQHEMRPYRPPRFSDSTVAPPVVEELEDESGASIRIRARNPGPGDDWNVTVDGMIATRIGRHRDGNGYTVYEISAEEFRKRVRSQLSCSRE